MPQDKSAISEFLSETKEEKSPFATEKQELFSEPIVKDPEEEEVDGEEKPLPFHKDPKVQRYVEKQIAKALKDVPRQSAVQEFREVTKGQEDEITDVLTRIIGNDTPEKQQGVKDLRKVLNSLEEKGAQRALAELGQQAEAQRQEDVKAQEELDNGFEEIEETFNVDLSSNAPTAKKTRSDFIDYVRKIAPKNEEGEVTAFPDLPSAWEEFQEKAKRPSNDRAKQLAARGMQRSGDATQQPKTGASWKDVERLFSKLG